MVILISLWVGWGIHLLLARVWHTFHFGGLIIVLWEGWRILDVSEKSFIAVYILNVIVLLIICNFCVFFTFVLVYVSVFVCLFVHQCVVVQSSVSYGNLNVSSNDEGSQFFKFHFLCNKGERSIYILSLESATSIQKPRNLLKVAYHSASCLLHHYTC